MSNRKGELSPTKRWAAAVFFTFGVGFVLLAVFGPIFFGAQYDFQTPRVVGLGLIAVAVYVFVGVNLPALDWSGIVVRILTAIIEGQAKKGGRE